MKKNNSYRINSNTIMEPKYIVKSRLTRTDDAEEKRVELHLHTRFSEMDALTDPEAVVARAAYWGMPAIAVTDHGVAQAFPDMWKAGKKHGVKIIYGLEAYFTQDVPETDTMPETAENRDGCGKIYHLMLLVKNQAGLKNLYYLISQSHLKYYHNCPIIPKEELDSHRSGILVGSACATGNLYAAVLKGEKNETLEYIASYYDYLEIEPVSNNRFLIDEGLASDEKDIQNWNRTIIELGRKLDKPVIAASDVHFLDPEDEHLRRILLDANQHPNPDRERPLYFRTTEEMLRDFMYLGESTAKEVVIDNTRKIAEQTEEIELLPKGLCLPTIENAAGQLRELVYSKINSIYGDQPPGIVLKRADEELKIILDRRTEVIYLFVQKLVQDSLDHGYLVGNRGGVGSSIVAFLSGITEINPLPPHYICPKCRYSEFFFDGSYGCGADLPENTCPVCGAALCRDGFNIPFETFLGTPEKKKTPDIDLNFSREYLANIHKYTETLFGSNHVLRAGTVGTLALETARSYVKDYKKKRGINIAKALEDHLALGITGVKHTTGQHPGGLVIIPNNMDITDFCPVQHPAGDPVPGIITTHFEYHALEANLLKIDELGHDDPTMLRMMEDMTGVNPKSISLSDPDTMSIFASASALGLPEDDEIIGKTGTIGIPDYGSSFIGKILEETNPKKFETLIKISGLAHGTGVWNGNVRDLILSGTAKADETVGCRDDVMIKLVQNGMSSELAYKTMEAVRKGKVKKSGSFPDDAEEQMKAMRIPEWWIESCRKIAYLFPRSHAATYAVFAFRIAWFKVHRPLAFYSAYFYQRSQKGGFNAKLMTGGVDFVRRKINEFKLHENLSETEADQLVTMEAVYEFYLRGYEFAPIDLNKSDTVKFLITEDGKLRLPRFNIATYVD